LKIEEMTPEPRDEPRMILPDHLNTLIELFGPGQILLIDLRTPSEFEKSHVFGAVNLRAPVNFVQIASFEMLERAFLEEQSRRRFSNWQSTKCMVFYDRAVEFALECPVADVLLHKMRAWGWEGRVFVLKGHYREFSASFSKYIVGVKMTKEAKVYVDGLREKSSTSSSKQDQSANLARYRDFLTQLDNEDRVHPSSMSPTRKFERTRSMEDHQRDLEAEFNRLFPDLYKKAQEVHGSSQEQLPPFSSSWQGLPGPAIALGTGAGIGGMSPGGKGKDNFDSKAQFVEYLDRGLTKIREGTTPQPATSPMHEPGYSKLAAETGYFDAYPDRPPSDEYVKVSRGGDEHLADDRAGPRAPGEASSPSGEDVPRKGRGGGFLNKVLRRA
jgi:rhodanese-related sulfurtransferase